jgi:hypothetical protein
MRLIVAAAFALSVTPAVAQSFATPEAVIEALYAGYGPAYDYPPEATPLRSARLNQLFAKDAEEAKGEIGRIDFDPFVNGQDYQLTKLEIAEPYYVAGKAVVRVTFENMGYPNELGFLLIEEDGWKIDDVWNGEEESGYDLLDMLQAPLP